MPWSNPRAKLNKMLYFMHFCMFKSIFVTLALSVNASPQCIRCRIAPN